MWRGWAPFCVAGAALWRLLQISWQARTFVWRGQHFGSGLKGLDVVGVRLRSMGMSRGDVVERAAEGPFARQAQHFGHGLQFSWQAQRFPHVGVRSRSPHSLTLTHSHPH